jgi:hypothetical protein
MVVPVDAKVADTTFSTDSDQERHNFDALTITTLTGIVGYRSTASTRRSYTNMYHFCYLLLATTCISSGAHIGFINAHPQRYHPKYSTCEHADVFLAPSVENSNAADFFMKTNHTRMPAFLLSLQTNKILHKFLLAATVALLWAAYGGLNIIEYPESHASALLDRKCVPKVPVEVVLRVYKETVHEFRKLLCKLRSITSLSDACFLVYIKDNEVGVDAVKQRTGAHSATTFPKIGREGETYLNHTLNRCHSLVRQTVFLPADIHDPQKF